MLKFFLPQKDLQHVALTISIRNPRVYNKSALFLKSQPASPKEISFQDADLSYPPI